MKYPAIYESEIGNIYLHANKSTLCHIVDGKCHDWCFLDCAAEQINDTNITHEYLANTYGEVQSPEHAEFIIELAKINGFKVWGLKRRINEIKTFVFDGGELCLLPFQHEGLDSSKLRKQITIPLPPKQIQTATPEEEFEMKQIMKNAGDNLVLGCESKLPKSNVKTEMPSAKECKGDKWPCVGDEVLVYSSVRRLAEIKGKAVKVIGKCTHSDGDTILTVEHCSLGVFAVANGLWIKKPKTPEEELRDDLTRVMQRNLTYKQIVDDLISNFDITKKPQ